MVVVPRRLGELLAIAGLVLLITAPLGWPAVLGYATIFLGAVLLLAGALLIGLAMAVRARLVRHHARTHRDDQKV
jgi:uncharacterized integral membrane protein